jgi:hypothetical protein
MIELMCVAMFHVPDILKVHHSAKQISHTTKFNFWSLPYYDPCCAASGGFGFSGFSGFLI